MSQEDNAAAAAAAKRRATKNRPNQTEAAVTAAVEPTPAPAAPIIPNKPVLVSRAMVAQIIFDAQNTSVTGARLPASDGGYGQPVPIQAPLIQPTSNAYGVLPNDREYVTAEFDAIEAMVPEGAKTPVTRVLWQKGWRIHRKLYTAVAERTSAEAQAEAAASVAKVPEGANLPPADMVTETASPILSAPPGAPA